MISNILAVLFYSTLFLFIFIKLYNCILVKKYNCKELYKEQINEIKQNKFSRAMKKLLKVSLIVVIFYIPYGITKFYFSVIFGIFDNFETLNDSFDMVSIIIYYFYFIFIIYKIYINMLLNKFLRK